VNGARLARFGTGAAGREVAALYVACIAVALAISMAVVEASGRSWLQAASALLDGAVLSDGRWGETLRRTAPLLMVAAGSSVAARAGVFNIGQEGQVLVGAMGSAFVLTLVHPGGMLPMFAGLLLGAATGGAWAGIAGVLHVTRRIPVVLTTLLLVYLAPQLAAFALSRSELLRSTEPGAQDRLLQSSPVVPGSRLGIIEVFGNRFPASVPVAVVVAAGLAWMLARTTWGFRLSMLGLNPRVAQRAGASQARDGMAAILVSGSTAGLAGAMMLAGGESQHQFSAGFASGAGWDGLLVALVARNNPLVAIPVALVFAGLRSGSTFLSVAGIEAVLVDVVRALLVVALFIPPAIGAVLHRRRAAAAITERI
jgi:simple sugar transport system permease protein